MNHGQRLDPRHHRELAPHVDRREGPHRLQGLGGTRSGRGQGPGRQASQEVTHLLVSGVHEHDVVVVAQLADRDQLRLGTLPRVLVMQHLGPAAQCLQLGDVLGAVNDVGVVVRREVGVIVRQPDGQVLGIGQGLGHGGLDRFQIGGVVFAVSEHVKESPEDTVLHLGVPGRRQPLVGTQHSGDLAVAVSPRDLDRQENIGAGARYVSPAGRPLLIQRHRKSVDPEKVQRNVAHQIVAAAIGALLHALQDVRARWRLHLEVTSDDRVELLEGVDDRQVQLGNEV